MKTTTIRQGAFTIFIEQNPDKTELSWDWMLYVHDELLDADSNFLFSEAVEDANTALYEFIEESFLEIAQRNS